MIPLTDHGVRPVSPRRSAAGELRTDRPHSTSEGRLGERSLAPPSLDSASGDDVGAAVAPLLAARQVVKSYRKGRIAIPVLRGVDFAVRPGEFTAIVGQSGSGKSTLLHLLGALDAPDVGEIRFEDDRVDNLPWRARDRFRNQVCGMIFQSYHLLPELTTLENVLAPLMIRDGIWRYLFSRQQHVRRAQELLELVGLGHRLKHKPRELSGGEMQRAAIARALVGSPRLLLADEPTGNLDRQTGQEIMVLLRTLNAEHNLTIVMVTHDHAIAAQADRTVRLAEGLVQQL